MAKNLKLGEILKQAGIIDDFQLYSYTRNQPILVDNQDKVHITYRPYSGTIEYTTKVDDVWVTETVVDTYGLGKSTLTMIDNNINICYGYTLYGPVGCATKGDGSWDFLPINNNDSSN